MNFSYFITMVEELIDICRFLLLLLSLKSSSCRQLLCSVGYTDSDQTIKTFDKMKR
jgi:hypothetical protein